MLPPFGRRSRFGVNREDEKPDAAEVEHSLHGGRRYRHRRDPAAPQDLDLLGDHRARVLARDQDPRRVLEPPGCELDPQPPLANDERALPPPQLRLPAKIDQQVASISEGNLPRLGTLHRGQCVGEPRRVRRRVPVHAPASRSSRRLRNMPHSPPGPTTSKTSGAMRSIHAGMPSGAERVETGNRRRRRSPNQIVVSGPGASISSPVTGRPVRTPTASSSPPTGSLGAATTRSRDSSRHP